MSRRVRSARAWNQASARSSCSLVRLGHGTNIQPYGCTLSSAARGVFAGADAWVASGGELDLPRGGRSAARRSIAAGAGLVPRSRREVGHDRGASRGRSPSRRPLRAGGADRLRRHGPRLERRRRRPAAPGRGEDHAGRPGRRRGLRRAFPRRGAALGLADAPQHHHGLRLRRGRPPVLPRDGARRGPARCRRSSATRAPSTPRTSARSWPRPPSRSARPTRPASCTATSSPPTSCCAPTAW